MLIVVHQIFNYRRHDVRIDVFDPAYVSILNYFTSIGDRARRHCQLRTLYFTVCLYCTARDTSAQLRGFCFPVYSVLFEI